MRRFRELVLAVATATVALGGGACGTSSGPPNPCAGVMCPSGQTCSSATGTCVPAVSDLTVTGGDDGGPGADATLGPDATLGGDATLGPDATLAPDMTPTDAGAPIDQAKDMTGGKDMAGGDGGLAVCANPSALTFKNNVATVMADTTAAMNNSSGTCGGSGPDVVYAFTLAQAQKVTVVVAPADKVYEPLIYVRKACADKSTGNEVACSDSGTGGATATIVKNTLAAGTYYLWVDGFAGSKGKSTVTVTLEAPIAAPKNDTCGGAEPLTFNGGVATLTFDTTTANDDTHGTCGGTGGADVVYVFTTTQAQRVTSVVTPAMNAKLAPVVYVRKACADTSSAAQLGCASASAGMAATLDLKNVPAGTYYLWVDGGTVPGAGKLTVTLGEPIPPPKNDTCAGAIALTFANGVATTPVDTTQATNKTEGTCGGTSGPEVVYTITTTQAQSLVATVVPKMGAKYTPVVYVRKACADKTAMNELGCSAANNDGDTAKLTIANLPAGTYFVWVDGFAGTFGESTLTLTVADPVMKPKNDTCAGAIALTFNNNVATTAVDTTGATNKTQGSCGGTTGPEVVYTFTTTQAQSLVAAVVPDKGEQLAPVVYVRKTCDDTKTEVSCASAVNNGDTATFKVNSLPAGTYFVWVDGFGGTAGKSTLTLTLGAVMMAPPNNGCGAPAPVMLNAPVMGDTSSSTDKLGSMPAMVCTDVDDAFPGADLTYVYTPMADGMLTITLHPDASYDPALWVMGSMCKDDGSNCIADSDVIGKGKDETITLMVKAGTPYYIVVDAYDAKESGPFTLTLK